VAINEFFRQTGCAILIRAHQPAITPQGINLSKESRVVTVFSSSHYCNTTECAAFVAINHGELAFTMFET
jgi:hypothetical protein